MIRIETEAFLGPNLFAMPLWTKCDSRNLKLSLGLFVLILGQFILILILSTFDP